jgi:hypothetical protein
VTQSVTTGGVKAIVVKELVNDCLFHVLVQGDLLLVWWRHWYGHEETVVRGIIVHRCSKQGMLSWTRWLLRRVHP